MVNVVDVAAARVTDTIGIGGMPTQLVVGHGGGLVYVVDGNEVVVLCAATNEVVDTIPAGEQLSCLAAGPDGRLYVADTPRDQRAAGRREHRRGAAGADGRRTAPAGGRRVLIGPVTIESWP